MVKGISGASQAVRRSNTVFITVRAARAANPVGAIAIEGVVADVEE